MCHIWIYQSNRRTYYNILYVLKIKETNSTILLLLHPLSPTVGRVLLIKSWSGDISWEFNGRFLQFIKYTFINLYIENIESDLWNMNWDYYLAEGVQLHTYATFSLVIRYSKP